MRKTISLLAALCLIHLLSACAITIPLDAPKHHPAFTRTEIVYQALAALDYAQTVTLSRHTECNTETGIGRFALGASPSTERVTGWFALSGTVHAVVSHWLDREADTTDNHAWAIAQRVWQVTGIGVESYYVAHNWSQGLRPFSGGHCAPPTSTQPTRPGGPAWDAIGSTPPGVH